MSRSVSGRVATTVLVLSLLGASAVLADQAALWTRNYDGDGHFNDWALSVALSGDNVYSSGFLEDAAGFDNGAFFIHRKDGTKLFEATFDGYGQDDEFRVVRIDGNGDVFVFGYAQRTDGTLEGVLQKRNPAGALLFERRLPPPAGYDSFDPRGMYVGSGTVYVVGTVTDPSGNQAIYVSAAPAGDNTSPLLWERILLGSLAGPVSGSNQGRLIAGDGTLLYLGGKVRNPADTGDAIYVARLDSSTGATAWDNATENPNGDVTYSRLSATGNDVLLSGGVAEADGTQSVVLSCREGITGALKWNVTIPAVSVSLISKPAPFVVSGSTVYLGASLDNGFLFLGAYRLANGSQLWSWTGGVDGQESIPVSVLFDGTRVAVAGGYPPDALTPPSAGVLYFDPAGNFLQKVLVPKMPGSAGSDLVLAAAADNTGNVFLAGSIQAPPNGGDYLVARFGTGPSGGGGGGGCLSVAPCTGSTFAAWNWLIFLAIPVVLLARNLFRGRR